MKLIERWSLMQNNRKENVQEHCLQVAIFAHALAIIKNRHFSGNVNPERVATLAIFHDASEVITGDLPTPVKYFNNDMKEVYKRIEDYAVDQLLDYLPKNLRPDYESVFKKNEEERELWRLVKMADTLSAYVKCLEESKAGNEEFNHAKLSIEKKLKSYQSPELDYFLEHFITSFSLSLDEMHPSQ